MRKSSSEQTRSVIEYQYYIRGHGSTNNLDEIRGNVVVVGVVVVVVVVVIVAAVC